MKYNYNKLLISALLLMCFQILKAQLYIKNESLYLVTLNGEWDAQDPKQYKIKFKEIVIKEGKHQNREIFNYDEEGRITFYLAEKVKDKEKGKNKNRGFVVTYALPNEKLKRSIVNFKNQKMIKTDSLFYNNSKKLLAYKRYDKNNVLKQQDAYVYDSILLKEHRVIRYKKQLVKTERRENYEYELDGQLKKITYYDNKGKAYKKTVFDCNPIGVNRKISKDSVYKCIKYDEDSLGNKMKITVENIKGKTTKLVQYFDENNKMIAYKCFDLKHDWPLYYVFYYSDSPIIKKWMSFKKGKENYRYEVKLDDKNNVIERVSYYQNKMISVLKNEYNTDGLLVVSKGYNKKNKLTKTVAYSYGF